MKFFFSFFVQISDQNIDILTMIWMVKENFCMDMVDLNFTNINLTRLLKEFTDEKKFYFNNVIRYRFSMKT